MSRTLDPWAILGIEPCEDLRRIRLAYTTRLKGTHPEDDPEGFMLLREAYEFLRERLESRGGFVPEVWVPEVEAPESTPAPPRDPEPVPKRPVRERPAPPPDGDVSAEVQALMERVREICRDEALRPSLSAWGSLIEDDALWSVDVRLAFGNALFEFLAFGGADPGWAVWLVLEQEFRWTERRVDLGKEFPSDAVDRVVQRIEQARTEKAPYYLQFRELFTFMEAADTLPDDRIPVLGFFVHHFRWFAIAGTILTLWLRPLVDVGIHWVSDRLTPPAVTLQRAARAGEGIE